MKTYIMTLRNPYLGDRNVTIPAHEEAAARALAVRLNKGYDVISCEETVSAANLRNTNEDEFFGMTDFDEEADA